MKKSLSVILSLLLLLTIFPVTANAAEADTSEHDRLIALACNVFPEYASAIRGESLITYSVPCNVDSNEVIFEETRSVSDNQSLTISQLASGDIVITDSDYSWVKIEESTSNLTDISYIGVTGTVNFTLTTTDTKKAFKLSNVCFTIYYTGSDYFTNTGTYSGPGYTVNSSNITSTRIHYSLKVDGTNFYFDVFFSDDKLYASVW